MSTLLIALLIWVVVAVGCHLRRKLHYQKNPHLWSRRHEGLISFSDTQYWWIMTLWPLAIAAAILYGVIILVCAVIEFAIDTWKSYHVPK